MELIRDITRLSLLQDSHTLKLLAFISCWETLSELCRATCSQVRCSAGTENLVGCRNSKRLMETNWKFEGKPASTPTCSSPPHCHIETHINPMLSTETYGSFALGFLIEKKSNAHQASAKIKLAHLSHSNLSYKPTQDISLQISMSMANCCI